MLPLDTQQVAELLAAELSAALPARRAALEFEQHYAGPDQWDRIKQGLFGLRIAESRLKGAGAAVLGALAVAEAENLEAEAAFLAPLLGPDAAGRRVGLLRLVCALLRLARYGEGRAIAHFSLARRGRPLGGHTGEALEWLPENELFFLALRRFEALLKEARPWTLADADWLRLRAATAPGRLRLRAAALRSGAERAAHVALPAAMEAQRRPYLDRGFEAGTALGWAVTGFAPKQAFTWGEEGIADPAQAQAWRDRGLGPEEAGVWAAADLLPDEAAAFKACGALDPDVAHRLRQHLGDVEYLLAWHRAGFDVAEVLRLKGQGVRSVEDALALRAAQAGALPTLDRVVLGGGLLAAAPAMAPPAPVAPVPMEASGVAPEPPGPAVTLPTSDPERWAQQRAWRHFGEPVEEVEDAWAAQPSQGGAWLGWGAYALLGEGQVGGGPEAFSLALGRGLMDVVGASEGVALPQRHHLPASLGAPAEWQGLLDRWRAQRGLGPVTGAWHLHAWAPARAFLFWGLTSKTIAVPWGDAIDFDSTETWVQRWARRSAEGGQKGAPCPCRLGRTLQGGWWVGLPGTVHGANAAGPVALEPIEFQVAWLAEMEGFCQTMGMRFREPQWHLVAGREE